MTFEESNCQDQEILTIRQMDTHQVQGTFPIIQMDIHTPQDLREMTSLTGLCHRYDLPVKPGYSPPKEWEVWVLGTLLWVWRGWGLYYLEDSHRRALDKFRETTEERNTHFDRFWGKLLLPISASSLHRQYLQFSGTKGKGLESLY